MRQNCLSDLIQNFEFPLTLSDIFESCRLKVNPQNSQSGIKPHFWRVLFIIHLQELLVLDKGGWAKNLANAAQLLVSRVVGNYRAALPLKHTGEKHTAIHSRPAVSLSLSPGLLPIHCSTLCCPPISNLTFIQHSLNIGKTFFSKKATVSTQ